MQILEALKSYASQPLTHQLLLSLLYDYKRPNDKIHDLIKSGVLIVLKRGLYIANPTSYGIQPEAFLIANHLFGPSYISSDSALSFHGLIPERVFEISSATIKQSRRFSNSVGVFNYTHLPLPYYSFGIINVQLSKQQSILLASAEKALFDKIVTTKGVVIRSHVQAYQYLIENLRLDIDELKKLNMDEMQFWLNDAPKKESLHHVLKLIESL
jgi:hypothetical protein